jgi:ubiquinone biosynthesis protein Coq4
MMTGMLQLQKTPAFEPLLRLWHRLRLFVPIWQVKRMPLFEPYVALMTGDMELDIVDEMSRTLLETPSFEKAVKTLQQDPACAALIAERYMAPTHDLEALLQYPEDSLGYLYAKKMRQQGFRAEDLYEGLSIISDASYVEARLSQTHDIWHIVTGFGPSVSDEIGLQAFHLTQFPYPLGVSLVSSSMMSTMIFSPEELPTLMESIRKGLEMGKAAKPLFAQKWEENWEKSLIEWRSELGIQIN